MKKRFFLFLIPCFLLMAISDVYAAGKLKVSFVKPPLNAPAMVERELGLFEKYTGRPVEYIELFHGPQQLQALMSDSVLFLPAVGSTSVLLAAANGADVRITGICARAPESFKIMTRPDSDIMSISGLKGARVAGPKGTVLHELLAVSLSEAGMSMDDVEFLPMSVPAALSALIAGRVDVALLTGVPGWKMTQKGFRVIADGKGRIGGQVLSVARGTKVKKEPETFRALMNARVDSVKWLKSHPEETAAIVAEVMNLKPEIVAAQLPFYDFSVEISELDLKTLQQTADFMFKNGFMRENVDVSSLLLHEK